MSKMDWSEARIEDLEKMMVEMKARLERVEAELNQAPKQ